MNKAFSKACDLFGASNMARHLKVTPQAVNGWKKGTSPIPIDRCPDIEDAVEQKVICEELRPDKLKFWSYFRVNPKCIESKRRDASKKTPIKGKP